MYSYIYIYIYIYIVSGILCRPKSLNMYVCIYMYVGVTYWRPKSVSNKTSHCEVIHSDMYVCMCLLHVCMYMFVSICMFVR